MSVLFCGLHEAFVTATGAHSTMLGLNWRARTRQHASSSCMRCYTSDARPISSTNTASNPIFGSRLELGLQWPYHVRVQRCQLARAVACTALHVHNQAIDKGPLAYGAREELVANFCGLPVVIVPQTIREPFRKHSLDKKDGQFSR